MISPKLGNLGPYKGYVRWWMREAQFFRGGYGFIEPVNGYVHIELCLKMRDIPLNNEFQQISTEHDENPKHVDFFTVYPSFSDTQKSVCHGEFLRCC